MPDPFEPDPLQKHKADLDLSWDAFHHTLGEGPTQAAPGNHKHPVTELVKEDGKPADSIAGVVMEYCAGTTTEGEPGYLGDVMITSSNDPNWVRLICGPNNASDPLWTNGYIMPSKDGIAHFAGYFNIYGNTGLPGDSFLRVRLTREPTAAFPYQDHTGYQDIEIREHMNILVPWMWMIQVEADRAYSLWVRLRRENATDDSGTVAIGSRQFKMHNFIFSDLIAPPDPDKPKDLFELIKSYDPWTYYSFTVGGGAGTTIEDEGSHNRDGQVAANTTGMANYTDHGQPHPDLKVFISNTTFGDGGRGMTCSHPLDFGAVNGYSLSVWTDIQGVPGFANGPYFIFGSSVTIGSIIDDGSFFVNHNGSQVARTSPGMGNNTDMKHLAVTYDKPSQTLKIYVQGVVVKTVTSVAAPTGVSGTQNFCWANYGLGSHSQHLAVWTKALTADQVSAIFTTGDLT